MDKTREADLEHLRQEYARSKDPKERAEIARAARTIAQEPKHIRDMRYELVREMRAGRSQNVRDINEYVKKKSKYQNID